MNIFDSKTLLLMPLIRWAIHHPGIMRSKLFLKAMILFPEKISRSYDAKVNRSDIDYHSALAEGFKRIEVSPHSILDLCTGTGLAALMAQERFPDARVVGIDQSKSML